METLEQKVEQKELEIEECIEQLAQLESELELLCQTEEY